MATKTLSIDGLMVDAPTSWTFYSMGHMILAQRDSGIGQLQISLAFRHDLRGSSSPNACLGLAKTFVSREGLGEPFDVVQVTDDDSLFGGFSYTVGEEFGRIWYRLIQEQLVLGVYSSSRSTKRVSEIQECEAIMKSARYAA